jgi:DNA repair protein RecN (Recombination protein N)
MLTALCIENVVLIERLEIEFRRGLCVLTGETGAGKSILLDALGLAMGARAESSLVRKGAHQAQVTAEFEIAPNHPCVDILYNANLQGGDVLVLRRSVSADGRSRAFINDQPVSAGLLKQVGESLLEIHGQFETQGLLDVGTHRGILDGYGEHPKENTNQTWHAWKTAKEELEKIKTESEKARAEESFLRAAVEDLDGLNPQPGEEESLSAARNRLMHREKVLLALATADDALNGENDPVQKALAVLSKVADKIGPKATEAMAALERASAETQEAIAILQSISSDMEEREDIESIDDRLYELRAQARKHHCTVDELSALRDRLAARLSLIERGDEALAEQMKAVDRARKDYIAAADALSSARKAAALKLDKLVQRELPPLKMDKAKFVTSIEDLPEAEWGEGGFDRVRFLVATNPGAAPGPINKIASGGEMARFMLALKVVMAEVGEQSLIFDEADSGVGGAVADAVGERLARLAKLRQILVVTHSPQVAARADHHYIVRKDGVKNVKTTVEYLGGDTARREEIARMLSGAEITKEARAAADRLLKTGT